MVDQEDKPKRFEIGDSVLDSMHLGDQKAHITRRLKKAGFNMDKPYEVEHSIARQSVIFTQEGP